MSSLAFLYVEQIILRPAPRMKAGMAKEGDGEERRKQPQKSSFVIEVPSYQEVIESSQRKAAPSSLFSPSPSFSQAFSSVKKSEFYSAPPPPPPQTSQASKISNSASTPSGLAGSGQSEVPPLPSSPASVTNYSQSRNAILVSNRQKGNPLLKHIRNVRWNFADIVCDYLLGQSSCALYISLRYHLLHPDYLYYRIRELQKNFKLRVVLCHIDVEDVVKPLLEVTKTALLHDCTLLCGWSLEECGRYLETIKVYENKSADIIQGQMDTDYLSRLNHALTSIRRVTKADVVTLGSTFGSLSHIMDVSMDDLARCPGIGERKLKRLYETFHEPFKRVVSNSSSVPEAPVQESMEPGSVGEGTTEKDVGDASKKKTGPVLTVKSALSAALSKHRNKVGKKKIKRGEKGKETSASEELGLESKNSNIEA